MNELRLEYHRNTGIRIQDRYCEDPDIEDYIEWLEEKLLDDEALFTLMNYIFYEKNKKTKESEPPST